MSRRPPSPERLLLASAAAPGLVDDEPLCAVKFCLCTVPDRWYRSSVRPGHETGRCRAGHVVHRRVGETEPEREAPRPWSPPPAAAGAVADVAELPLPTPAWRRQQAAKDAAQPLQDGAGRAIGPEAYSDAPPPRQRLLGAC